MIYSPSAVSLFCYICKLYSPNNTLLCKEGFSDWQHTKERLREHENSFIHRKAICDFSNRSIDIKRIDCQLVLQYKKDVQYWRDVLKRTVAAVQFLAQRGLAIFGENEIIGNGHNGNFLGIMELIAKFDIFLKEHLNNYGNVGSGKTNYISSYTVREIIILMGDKVLKHIIEEIKNSKYFGMIVDSTPDITHIDQLAIVLRYVNCDGQPVERFVKFQDIYGHTAEYLTITIVEIIKNFGIDIKNCVGQWTVI